MLFKNVKHANNVKGNRTQLELLVNTNKSGDHKPSELISIKHVAKWIFANSIKFTKIIARYFDI